MKEALVGIDLGTSGARVEVYDLNGRLIGLGKSSIERQTADEWVRALKEAASEALSVCEPGCTKHVTVDSTSGTLLLVDEFGGPIVNPIMYYEKDTEAHNEVMSKLSPELARKVHVDPTSPIVKIYGIAKRSRELWERVRWVLSPTTWLLYSLCYERGSPWQDLASDHSNLMKVGLDIFSSPPRLLDEVYDVLGLDADKVPRPADSGTPLCKAKGWLASELNLEGATIYHGMTDGNAAALAGGALTKGETAIYSGSTTVPKIVSDRVVEHPAIYYHIHPLGGFLAGGATGFTGAFLEWLAESVFGMSVQEAVSLAERASGPEPIFLPPGDRAPTYDPQLKAAIVGLELRAGEPRENAVGRIVRGVMIGITLLEAEYLRVFEEVLGVKIGSVGMVGGTSRSPYWNSLRASVYNREVLVYGDNVAKGALVPVLVRGFGMSPTEVKRLFLKPLERYAPSSTAPIEADLTRALKRLREVYDALGQRGTSFRP